jgi:hypothetical protein
VGKDNIDERARREAENFKNTPLTPLPKFEPHRDKDVTKRDPLRSFRELVKHPLATDKQILRRKSKKRVF